LTHIAVPATIPKSRKQHVLDDDISDFQRQRFAVDAARRELPVE